MSAVRCQTASIALHYFLLAALGWMVCEALQLYSAVVLVFQTLEIRQQMLRYAVVGWGLPAVIVAATAGSALPDYTSSTYCWLDGSRPTIWAFFGPALAAISLNVCILGIVIWKIYQCRRGTMVTVRAVAALGTLVGLTWLFGFLVPVINHISVQYLFAVFNSSQGVSAILFTLLSILTYVQIFIFYFHCYRSSEIRLSLIKSTSSSVYR